MVLVRAHPLVTVTLPQVITGVLHTSSASTLVELILQVGMFVGLQPRFRLAGNRGKVGGVVSVVQIICCTTLVLALPQASKAVYVKVRSWTQPSAETESDLEQAMFVTTQLSEAIMLFVLVSQSGMLVGLQTKWRVVG